VSESAEGHVPDAEEYLNLPARTLTLSSPTQLVIQERTTLIVLQVVCATATITGATS